MKRYFVENGKIVVNKYCIEYAYSSQGGGVETDFSVTHYISDDAELRGLLGELETKGIAYNVTNLDVCDILKYNGAFVESEEQARRLVEPSLEEIKADKISEISDACRDNVFKGIDVALSDGSVKHFSLKTEDQINLNGLVNQVSIGNIKAEEGVPYHADGELCTLFSIADFTLVADMATKFILQQTTYCNHLMAFIRSLETREGVEKVFYGQELTGEFLNSYNRVIGGDSDE